MNLITKLKAFGVGSFLSLAAVVMAMPVQAAGDSAYIPPTDTSYNIDMIVIFGVIAYVVGLILIGYGKFFRKFTAQS